MNDFKGGAPRVTEGAMRWHAEFDSRHMFGVGVIVQLPTRNERGEWELGFRLWLGPVQLIVERARWIGIDCEGEE